MKHKGFTLVELLVSISLIGIISSISLANYAEIRTKAQMEEDVNTVVIALRDAQSKALSPDKSEFGITNGKLCSVGVGIQETSVDLFVSEDTRSNADCSSSTDLPPYEILALTESQIIGSLYEIEFSTPFGGPTIVPSTPVATITLQSTSDSDIVRSILVYESGLIDVQ